MLTSERADEAQKEALEIQDRVRSLAARLDMLDTRRRRERAIAEALRRASSDVDHLVELLGAMDHGSQTEGPR